MLSTGLFIGGAGSAIAVAEPGSGGSSTHGHDGAHGPSLGSSPAGRTASSPAGGPGGLTDTLRKTVQSGTSTLGSVPKPEQPRSTVAKIPANEPGAPSIDEQKKDSDLVAAVPNPIAPVTDVVAPVNKAVAPVTDAVAPATNAVTPVPDVVAPVPDVVAPVPDVVAPVPGVVAPVPDVAGLLQNVVRSVLSPVAQGSDVIAAIQQMLTSVAGVVVPLTQLPSDLSALLGVPGVEPSGRHSAAAYAPMLAAPLGPSHLPLGPPLAGIPGLPLAGNAIGAASLGGIATTTRLGAESSAPEKAPLAPNGATSRNKQSFFQKAVRDVLIPASLSALAAMALPGVGGLLVLTAAGVRVGYRQAKAGFAMRATGVARFAGPGPLGVVRTGSSVVVRPLALRVIHTGAPGAGRLLDDVA
ncbi:MAG: hypothetical protein JWR32_300 [Mycobacterium sp.]|nr:hypothetical protein [Mycobacterium sp.]